MLRSVKLIGGNLLAKRATVRLPDRVPPPERFRGEVVLEAEKCIACGMCAYVCVSNTITGIQEQDAFTWTYEPGQCTFCARCVERCPGQAISMAPDTARIYTRHGELRVQHTVAFPRCPECGQTVRPAAGRLVRLAFDEIVDDTRRLLTLCERCKRKHVQLRIFAGGVDEAEQNP